MGKSRSFRLCVASMVTAMAALGISACSTTASDEDALEKARESKVIKVGIAGERPYAYTDESGRATGEGPEVARAVFASLGIPSIEAVTVPFGSLIPGLEAGQFDVTTAGQFITPERCEKAAFSIPDYITSEAFLVPKGNPEQLHRYEDITAKNLKVAVMSGAVEQGYMKDLGVPDANVLVFADQNAVTQAVIDKRAYGAAHTNIAAEDIVKQDPTLPFEVTQPFTPVINGEEQIAAGGFVFRRGDNELREAFDKELKALHDSGKWLEIVQPFGFTKDNLPKPGLTTESLCAPTP